MTSLLHFSLFASRAWLATAAGLLALTLAPPASALPTSVTHLDDPSCDPLVVPNLVDELGIPTPPFPADELIDAFSVSTNFPACVPGVPSVMVRMTNLTSIAFDNVWYVADALDTTIINFDGFVNDGLAFRIDSIVTDPFGVNLPLFSESGGLNDIFEPGETWEFIIEGYSNILGLPPEAFMSAGVGSFSSGDPLSSGSIIATVKVPEPHLLVLMLLGLAALGFQRRRGSSSRSLRPWLAGTAGLLALTLAVPASALLTPVTHFDDPASCDPLLVPNVVDELGLPGGPFPADELIVASSIVPGPPACVPGTVSHLVRMTNLTSIAFDNVWYVADFQETTIANFDGFVNDSFAFRIDSTITDPFGVNLPLFSESAGLNDIFEPGETWEFIIEGYFNAIGLPPEALGSAGVGLFSVGDLISSGSIIATVKVPEPHLLVLMLLGLAGLGFQRRRGSSSRSPRPWLASTAGLLALTLAVPASALLTSVTHVDDPASCDPLSVPSLVDELGIPVGLFPPDERIDAFSSQPGPPACDPLVLSHIVRMTNLTSIAFDNVWYVADPLETVILNFDGRVNDGLAFRIDTVITDPFGIHHPLLSESGGLNDIFEPGESWEFLIDGYFNILGLPPEAFLSAGVGIFSFGDITSSGSIIATPVVAEPPLVLLVLMSLAGIALQRRRGSSLRNPRPWLAGAAGLLALTLAVPASALLTSVTHVDAPDCDPLVVPNLVDELGLPGGPFPADELIDAVSFPSPIGACAPAGVGDTFVEITNLTGIAFDNVWYVADALETTIFNFDGSVNDGLAFRIDTDISDPFGTHHPLFSESGGINDIFEPGETWVFIIDGYSNLLGLPPEALASAGVGSFSVGDPISSGSIIATPQVPEPHLVSLLLLGLAGIGFRRRRSASTARGPRPAI